MIKEILYVKFALATLSQFDVLPEIDFIIESLCSCTQ